MQDHPQSRRALTGAVKTLLAEEEDDGLHISLCQLPAQGEMARAWGGGGGGGGVSMERAVQQLPPEASLNTLPTNSNLHMWRKKASDICPLCRASSQTLPLPQQLSHGYGVSAIIIAISMMQSSRSSVTSSRHSCLLSFPSPLTPPRRSIASHSTSPPPIFDRTSCGGVTRIGSYGFWSSL